MIFPNIRFLLSMKLRQMHRHIQNVLDSSNFATFRSPHKLPHIIKSHSLPIYRNFSGVDRSLFDNKKINLSLAISTLNNITIPPKKTFSLWYLVGPPTAQRGYKDGLTICMGRPSRDIGGGLCQLANAIHWLALHSDLEVTERHRHSLDLFPDDGRKIPFGTGATIVYNYKDIRLFNPTPYTFQLHFELTDNDLLSTLRASEKVAHTYNVSEKDHRYEKKSDGLYRCNTIVRQRIGLVAEINEKKELFHNHCKCQYAPKEVSL